MGKFCSGVSIGTKKFDQTTPFPLLGDLRGSPNGRENPSSAGPDGEDPVSPATRRNPTERKMQSRVDKIRSERGAHHRGERDVRASPPRGTPGTGRGHEVGGWVGAAPEVLVGGDGGGEAESREGRGA